MTKQELEALRGCGLFTGISGQPLEKLLVCLGAETCRYEKNALLYQPGQTVSACTLILSGAVRAETVNDRGERTMLAWHGPGALVGDVLMATPGGICPVYVVAAEPVTAAALSFRRIMGGCEACCPAHSRLRENLIGEIAQKYWAQRQRLGYLGESSLRRRIVMYLLDRAQGAATFSLGQSREDMADYLCVNRSALSRELARMKQEGLLDYYRDTFRLTNPQALEQYR